MKQLRCALKCLFNKLLSSTSPTSKLTSAAIFPRWSNGGVNLIKLLKA